MPWSLLALKREIAECLGFRVFTHVFGAFFVTGTSVQGTNWVLRLNQLLRISRMQDLSISDFILVHGLARKVARGTKIRFFAVVPRAASTARAFQKREIDPFR